MTRRHRIHQRLRTTREQDPARQRVTRHQRTRIRRNRKTATA